MPAAKPGTCAVPAFADGQPLGRYVVATPDLHEELLGAEDEALIMATDGLWDVISNQEAVDFIKDTKVSLTRLAARNFKLAGRRARMTVCGLCCTACTGRLRVPVQPVCCILCRLLTVSCTGCGEGGQGADGRGLQPRQQRQHQLHRGSLLLQAVIAGKPPQPWWPAHTHTHTHLLCSLRWLSGWPGSAWGPLPEL